MHLSAIGFFIAPFYFFFQIISDLLSNNAVDPSWGFGQVVAILATVPTLVEFVHAYLETKDGPRVKKVVPRFLAVDAHEPSYEQLELRGGSSGPVAHGVSD